MKKSFRAKIRYEEISLGDAQSGINIQEDTNNKHETS